MEPIDASVFEGRNPAWREWWENKLDEGARTQVEDAVRKGTGINDPSLEPFVYGLIARARRGLKLKIVQMAFLAVLSGSWVLLTAAKAPWWHAFWIVLFLVDVTAVPWTLRLKARSLTLAERELGSAPNGQPEKKG